MSAEEIYQGFISFLPSDEHDRYFMFRMQEEIEDIVWFERAIVWKTLCEYIDPRELVDYIKDKIMIAIEDGKINGW